MSGTGPEDDDLERLLADSAALRRGYRSASLDEPPAALDAAIRAAARREVKARPRLATSPFGGSWRVPLSIAAVVVVSATVTLMVAEHKKDVPGADTRPAAAPAQQQAEATAPPELAKKRTDDAASDAPAPSGSSSQALQGKRDDAGRGAEVMRAAPPASPRAPLQEADRYDQKPFPAPAKTEPAPAPAPADKASSAQPAAGASAGGTVVRSEPERGPVREEKQDALKDEDSRAQFARRSPAAESKAKASAPSAAVPAPPASPGRAAPETGTADAAAPSVQPAQEGARVRALEKNALRLSGKESVDQLRQDAANAPWERDPQAWLEHVKELQAAGRIEEAQTSYKAFRSRYPDFRLPAGFVAPVP